MRVSSVSPHVPSRMAGSRRVAGVYQELLPLIFVIGTCLVSVLFILGTLGRSRQKLFWHDEILTVVVSTLSPRQAWEALRAGLDLSPPGFHILTRVANRVFGAGPVGTRMPAVLGVWLAAVCTGVFVRRRCGAAAGLAALLLLLCSGAYSYAYEARPYGPVLGFAAAAMVCWQSAASTMPRRLWLAGLFASLAAALLCHYYAVLLFAPLAAGELVRFRRTLRADWHLWMTVLASTLPLWLTLPLIMAVREYSAGFFAAPTVRTVLYSYESETTQLAVPLLLTLVIAVGFVVFGQPNPRTDARVPLDAGHEMALAATLVLLPVIAYVLAAGWTHALVPRYYLSWTIGLSILLPFTITWFAHDGTRVVSALAIALFVWFGARQALSARLLTQPTPDLQSAYPLLLTGTTEDLPIVISHAHVYLATAFYAGPGLQRRLLLFKRPGETSSDIDTARRAFRALDRWMPLQVVDFDAFTSREKRFYVYGPATALHDLLRSLGAVLVFRGRDPDNQLFAPSRPGPNYLFEVSFERVDPSAG